MKRTCYTWVLVFVIVMIVFGPYLIPLSATPNVLYISGQTVRFDEGFVLFTPMNSQITYLIDKNGSINHTWSSSYLPGESVYLLDDGSIIRTKKLSFQGGGAGGGVQKIEWDNTLTWDFSYYTSDYLHHHDLEMLPNGNVLLIAWEYKTKTEAINAGRDPNQVGNILKPDHIVEVQPTGPSSGDIVWEWHAWDHLIQDFDPTKYNYGVVGDHPELIDINFGSMSSDWMHTNSIDYNEEFDQILLSVHNFNEVWVIDHSTTTAEAAGHTGGNSGKGGDLLYRWGNPQAYDAGTNSDQKFFGQHDSTWIASGCPGEGNILVFNNGVNRFSGSYSSIDELVPPVDSSGNYYLEPGSAYGPEYQTWIYMAENPYDFYAFFIGGAQRLPDGNTLICDGPEGRFFEVTPQMETVWEYENSYPSPYLNNVFKVQYIPPEDPQVEEPDLDCVGNLEWQKVNPGGTVIGSFQVQNIGANGSFLNWKVASNPEWGNWTFTPMNGEGLSPDDGLITVNVAVVAPSEEETDFEGYIQIENQDNSEDFDVIPVVLKTPTNKNTYYQTIFQIILKLIQRFPWLEKIYITIILTLTSILN